MRAAVVYESMYGNTRTIAEAIAAGLGADVIAVPVREATPALLADVDLLVVGGPTHVHGMSRATTRRAAIEATKKPENSLVLEPGVDESGLREWFASLPTLTCRAAAFDTRINVPAVVSGRAPKRIARLLRHHGAGLATKPESFLVDKQSKLLDGEQARARAWGEQVATGAGRR